MVAYATKHRRCRVFYSGAKGRRRGRLCYLWIRERFGCSLSTAAALLRGAALQALMGSLGAAALNALEEDHRNDEQDETACEVAAVICLWHQVKGEDREAEKRYGNQ